MDLNLHFKLKSLQQLSLVTLGGYVVSRLFKYCFYNGLWRLRISELRNWDNSSSLILKTINSIKLPSRNYRFTLYGIASDMWIHSFQSLLDWLSYIEPFRYAGFENAVWKNVCFKSTGELDLLKMHTEALRYITKQKDKGLIPDFYMACELCSEDAALEIFQKMPPEEKDIIVKNANSSVFSSYWHCFVCCKSNINPELCNKALERSLELKKTFAVLYFWDKLDVNKKWDLSQKCFKYAVRNKVPKLMCLAYEYMEDGMIIWTMAEIKCPFLHCLLQWPYIELFDSVYYGLESILSDGQTCSLIKNLIYKRLYCDYIASKFVLKMFYNYIPPCSRRLDAIFGDGKDIMQKLLGAKRSEKFRRLVKGICKGQEICLNDDSSYKDFLPSSI